MEKVQITVEQENILNRLKKWCTVETLFIDFVTAQDDWIAEEYKPLFSLKADEYARVLLGWYEVKKEKAKRLIITDEQEKAFQHWKAHDFDLADFILSEGRGQWDMEYKCLNNITDKQFALMMKGYYGVEKSERIIF